MATIVRKEPKTMYVTKRLVKRGESSLGLEINFASEVHGMCGVLHVFESKEKAEMWYGIGVETFEIELVC